MISQSFAEERVGFLRKLLALVAVLSVIFQVLPSHALAQAQSLHCKMQLLAVDPESGKGLVIDVSVQQLPSGQFYRSITRTPLVFVRSTSTYIEEDVRVSAELAHIYASLLAGAGIGAYQYQLSASTRVEGLSATLGFFVIFYSMLSQGGCASGVAATGVIGPGGLVGAVGGLQQKLHTASSSGLSLVLIPALQAREVENYSNIAAPVYTIYDAVERLRPRAFAELVDYSEELREYESYFEESYRLLRQKALEVIGLLEGLGWRDEHFNLSVSSLKSSEAEAARGRYYVASSLAYRALVNALTSRLLYAAAVDPREAQRLIRELALSAENTTAGIRASVLKLAGSAYRLARLQEAGLYGEAVVPDVVLADFLAVAYARVVEASYYLALLASGVGDLEEAAEAAASAYARAESASAWLSIAEKLASGRAELARDPEFVPFFNYFVDVHLKYVEYMGVNKSLIEALRPKNLTPRESYVANLGLLSFISSFLLRSQVFIGNETGPQLSSLKSSLLKALSLLREKVGSLPPYPLLLLGLVDAYVDLGESRPELAGYLGLGLFHVASYLFAYTTASTLARLKGYMPPPIAPRGIALIPAISMIIVGVLLVRRSLKSRHRL
ncbi:MAG: S16 family serine protease [Desulfurococcaceae archaeon]